MSEEVAAQKENSATPSQASQQTTPVFEEPLFIDERYATVGSNSNISKELEGIKPKTIRRSLNWQNITVEAPNHSGGGSLPGGIQRQQKRSGAAIEGRVSPDLEQKSAGELSNSTIFPQERSVQPKIAGSGLNWGNITVEAPRSSAASSTYPGGIQRQQTSDVKEQEESSEPLQTQSECEIQPLRRSESEQQETEELPDSSIQTKLTVGTPGDKYEQEADTMVAKVMAMPDSAIQQQPIQRQRRTETEALGRQTEVNLIAPPVQRSLQEEIQMKSGMQRASDESIQASSSIESRLASSKGGGSSLPDNVRSFMEPRFGADFSSIKLHTDSNAVQMNKELGAQAFARASDIYYGAGKSPGNNELTAHELTHTIQQGAAVRMNKEVCRQPQQEEEQETIQAKEISISQQEKSKQVSPSNKESSERASEVETETLATKALSGYNTNLILNKELRQKPQEEEQETTQEEPIQAKQLTNTPPFNNKDTLQYQPASVTSVSPRI